MVHSLPVMRWRLSVVRHDNREKSAYRNYSLYTITYYLIHPAAFRRRPFRKTSEVLTAGRQPPGASAFPVAFVKPAQRAFSCAAKAAFVSLRLAEAEGRKGVAARGEGRISEKQKD